MLNFLSEIMGGRINKETETETETETERSERHRETQRNLS